MHCLRRTSRNLRLLDEVRMRVELSQGRCVQQPGARKGPSMTEREQERAAIVAWLRKVAPMLVRTQQAALEMAADNIEAGSHLRAVAGKRKTC